VPNILRRFLYLDAELTGEFLAQLEGGRFSEEEQSRRGTSGRELSGGIGAAGVSAKAGKRGQEEEEASRLVRQTPESEFARLVELLVADGGLQFLESFDDEIWGQITRGEILEIEADVAVSSLRKIAELAGAFEPLMKIADLAGEPIQMDKEAQAGLSMLTSIGKLTAKVPIVARAAGAPDYKFIASLEPAKIKVELDELEGEATLIAKVQRKLRPGETHTILDAIPGISALPRDQRREVIKGLENSAEFPDLVIPSPATIVTPIAIYR
jgi:hypothetical protein